MPNRHFAPGRPCFGVVAARLVPTPALATLLWMLAALLLAAAPLPARAEDDLPGRVGRIAEFAGQLYLSPQEQANEWEAVGLNYPVITGDNLWVSGDGRAEVDYGGGQFRIAGDTSLHVSRLDDRQLALFVAQGRLVVRVRVLDAGDATRVDTPNTQVTLMRPGLYRIDVMPDRQQTTVTVREGEAIVALANGGQQALPGQSATVSGSDPADAYVSSSVGIDGFDAWSAERDRRYERARSTAYVSRQMVGYADLDEYGTWQTYPDYGAVWFPATVAAGWAPYSDGYWANVGGWGFTWVDYAPWGYAPYHYGRWAWIGGRWGWCPGAYVARPVWAPALVAWFGGAGWGLSASLGGPVYGWVPLGWGEPYLPWWKRCSHSCWTHYNRPYNVNVTVRPVAPPTHYRNVNVPGAVTAVPATTIRERRPIPTNRVQVPPSAATTAPVLATAPSVAPGPAPGPRPKPGVGSVPPPASTLVPPSRAGFAGSRDGFRSRGAESPPATGSAPARDAGSTPRASTPVPPQPAEPATPRSSQRRPREVPTVPGTAVVPAEPSPPTTGSPAAATEGRSVPRGRVPSQSQAGRAHEGQGPSGATGTGGGGAPPSASPSVQLPQAGPAGGQPTGAAPTTSAPSEGRGQGFSRRPQPTPPPAPLPPTGSAPPPSAVQGGVAPTPAPAQRGSATGRPPAAQPSPGSPPAAQPSPAGSPVAAPPPAPSNPQSDSTRSAPRGEGFSRSGRGGADRGDSKPDTGSPQGNPGR